jgi:hypothetical protein
LVMIHARGAHPPWDLSREEALALPPEDYGGTIEARTGAITLASLRGSRGRLATEDHQRIEALTVAALRKQDAALGGLVAILERHKERAPYLLVVTGDVAPGGPGDIPFAPTPLLRDEYLLVPTLVVFPDGSFAGRRVNTTATTADISRTVLDSLGLDVPPGVEGWSLHRAAAGLEPASGGAHTATLGSAYVTRWGPWSIRGELRKRPSLCSITVDPACSQDVLDEFPMVSSALWRATFASVSGPSHDTGRLVGREAAVIDAETLAALRVFGHGR